MDLGNSFNLAWIGLSFDSYSGSDAANQYTVLGSNDAQSWVTLVDNTENQIPGYQNKILSGKYRNVRVNVIDIYNVDHGKSAAWEVGLYEVFVYESK